MKYFSQLHHMVHMARLEHWSLELLQSYFLAPTPLEAGSYPCHPLLHQGGTPRGGLCCIQKPKKICQVRLLFHYRDTRTAIYFLFWRRYLGTSLIIVPMNVINVADPWNFLEFLSQPQSMDVLTELSSILVTSCPFCPPSLMLLLTRTSDILCIFMQFRSLWTIWSQKQKS